jgi:hypothetical protein
MLFTAVSRTVAQPETSNSPRTMQTLEENFMMSFPWSARSAINASGSQSMTSSFRSHA